MSRSGNDQEPVFPGQHTLSKEDRKGVMIADGLIWCESCGEQQVNIAMGHRKCRYCRHPKLGELKAKITKRYVDAGLPVPSDFSAFLGPDDSD